jgi:hypothetical protein
VDWLRREDAVPPAAVVVDDRGGGATVSGDDDRGASRGGGEAIGVADPLAANARPTPSMQTQHVVVFEVGFPQHSVTRQRSGEGHVGGRVPQRRTQVGAVRGHVDTPVAAGEAITRITPRARAHLRGLGVTRRWAVGRSRLRSEWVRVR